ncbi:MAG: hypothetical protein WBX25_29850 [Rhodomicrobium sp.]
MSMLASECDRKASNPFDPWRAAAGVPSEKLDAEAAIAACTQEIGKTSGEARFYYLRGRAEGKAEEAASQANNEELVKSLRDAKLSDLKTAAERGYVFALHDLAPEEEDRAKTAVFYFESFNRVVACCAARAIAGLFTNPGLDQQQVNRVASALLGWAAALGDPNANRDLARLYLKRTIAPPSGKAPEQGAYYHLKIAERLFVEEKNTDTTNAARNEANSLAAKMPAFQVVAANDEIGRWTKKAIDAQPPWLTVEAQR